MANPMLSDDQAVIVAARFGLGEYLEYSVYMCQPNRSFRPVTYFGFYCDRSIHRQVPRILGQVESVVLGKEGLQTAKRLPEPTRTLLISLIERLIADDYTFRLGLDEKVIFLTAPDSKDTLQLKQNIKNDISGGSVAFTRAQRYVSVGKLMQNPSFTTQLLDR